MRIKRTLRTKRTSRKRRRLTRTRREERTSKKRKSAWTTLGVLFTDSIPVVYQLLFDISSRLLALLTVIATI